MGRVAGRQPPDPSTILDVVAELLEADGYDGWQLREVAQRARVSLRTVYENFGSRDQLIVAAVVRWMEANVFRPIEPPAADQPPLDVVRDWLHAVFEPWEQHPGMLTVFVRAARTVDGGPLQQQGIAAARPMRADVAQSLEGSFGADINTIMTNVTEGAVNRFVNGQIQVTDILPILDLTLERLKPAAAETHDAEPSKPKTAGRNLLTRRSRSPREREAG